MFPKKNQQKVMRKWGLNFEMQTLRFFGTSLIKVIFQDSTHAY